MLHITFINVYQYSIIMNFHSNFRFHDTHQYRFLFHFAISLQIFNSEADDDDDVFRTNNERRCWSDVWRSCFIRFERKMWTLQNQKMSSSCWIVHCVQSTICPLNNIHYIHLDWFSTSNFKYSHKFSRTTADNCSQHQRFDGIFGWPFIFKQMENCPFLHKMFKNCLIAAPRLTFVQSNLIPIIHSLELFFFSSHFCMFFFCIRKQLCYREFAVHQMNGSLLVFGVFVWQNRGKYA